MDAAESTQEAGSLSSRIIALVGRRDEPTDAVRDYCAKLAGAVQAQGVPFEIAEVSWFTLAWLPALWRLWRLTGSWKGHWVLVQYTAMMWSQRGFPVFLPVVLGLLRARGCRVAVVFHDVRCVPGKRWIDRQRVALQYWVMRTAYRLAERAVLTIPPDRAPWLPADSPKAVFIPVGANIPSLQEMGLESSTRTTPAQKTVAVFGVSTWPVAQQQEVEDIVHAVLAAAEKFPGLRLLVMGRGAEEAGSRFRETLNGCKANLDVRGILPGAEVSRLLASSDVLLFVRGPLSTRRGSGLAAVACGVPLVGYGGRDTTFPLTEAGAVVVPEGDRDALSAALLQVLAEDELRSALREKSLKAHAAWFSWEAIARKMLESLAAAPRPIPPKATAKGHARALPRPQPMRVLVCSEAFLPLQGGVQTFVLLLTEGLVQRRHEVMVVTDSPAGEFDDSKLGFPIVRRPGLRGLWRLIGQADVVQLAGPSFLPLLFGLIRRKPVVVEHHGYQAICPNGLLMYEPTYAVCPGHFAAGRYHKCMQCNAATVGWMRSLRMLVLTFPRRWMCRMAAANAAVTQHVLGRLKLPKSRVVYNGVPDPRDSEPVSTALREPSTPLCFAYVGRLVHEKGLLLLLTAARRLRDQGYGLRLKLIGDGSRRAFLERQARALSLLEDIVFTGFLSGEVLKDALRDVDVLVMPSTCEETAGFSAIEFMMAGRLVIASDIGGLTEVVGDAGLKFEPGNADALVRSMREVLENRNVIGKFAGPARARALKLFGQERMVGEYLQIYGRLIQKREGSQPMGEGNVQRS